MAKTKISEFSATPGNNTDIDGINIAEGCAPSGINDAIRELMSQLKDFQAGTAGDSFNGPVGTTTAAAGAFTTLTASSTVSGTGFSNYLASPPAIGGTAAAAGSFTTLTTSSTVTHNGGTANGVAYLNGSKVLTTGSVLTFDGSFYLGLTGAMKINSNGYKLRFYDATGATGYGYLYTDGTNFQFDSGNTQPLSFLINGSEQMRLTSTGLGIGTSSPSQKLEVAGSAKLTGTNLQIAPSTTTSAAYLLNTNGGGNFFFGIDNSTGTSFTGTAYARAIYSGGAYPLVFLTNDLERMRLDSSGNLGLGVTPSAWESGQRAFDFGITGTIKSNTSTGSVVSFGNNCYYGSSSWRYKQSSQAAALYDLRDTGEHRWYYAASGTAGDTITFTQAMTLDASGRLFVGTTSGATKLDVRGTSNTVESTIQIVGNTVSSLLLGQNADGGVIRGQGGNNALTFWTGGSGDTGAGQSGTERARIDSSGNLLVGTTSSSATTNGFKVNFGQGATIPAVSMAGASSANTEVNYTLYSTTAAAYRFYVGYGGTIYATSTTITAISDQRLKENIRDLDAGLSEVMALKPRKFDWKPGKGKDKKNDRGWIAQEFEQVFPDMVDTWADPAPEGEEPYKAVNADLIPVLVKAIQEQQAIIETLTARVAALESK